MLFQSYRSRNGNYTIVITALLWWWRGGSWTFCLCLCAYNDLVTTTTTTTLTMMMTTTTTTQWGRDTWIYYHLDGKLIQMRNAIRMSDALCATVQWLYYILCNNYFICFWLVHLFSPIVNLSGNKTVINVIPALMDFKYDIVWGNPFQETKNSYTQTRRLSVVSRISKSK